MHHPQVIYQCHITGLPLQIHREFLSEGDRRLHGNGIQGGTVSERDGPASDITRVLPAEKCRDELVKKRTATVG